MYRLKGKFISSGKNNRVANCKREVEANNDSADKNNSGSELKWNEGRRIVELIVLAEALGECQSVDCTKVLDLRRTINETRIGLASILWVECECGYLNRVPTGNDH